MGNRVYILLDIMDGKAEQAAKVLRESPGVVVVDILEGPPDVIMIIDAGERQQLARLTNQVLASVETMTEHVCLIPAGDELSTNQKK